MWQYCVKSGEAVEKSRHDKLVSFAERMTELSKLRRFEQRRFIDWLQDQLYILSGKKGGVGIEVLSGKIKDYLGDSQKGQDG